MPRIEDYRTNEAGYISPYDIILDTTGFNFYGDDPINGEFNPADEEQKETPLLFNDLSNGMGMGYSGVPNTYAFAVNGYTRTPRKFMPAGKLTEIDLAALGFTEAELAGEIRCALEYVGQYGSATVYVGAGRHIISLGDGTETPVDEYDVGIDCQLDTALLYNNFPLFSTDQNYDNWQYLTSYDIVGAEWITANSTGVDPDYSVRSGAANYAHYPHPVYLQKMVSLFQEVDGTGGFRILGNDSLFTYVQTQSIVLSDIIGNTDIYSSSLSVGDSSYAITNIAASNRIPFITKADGVYGIESSGIYCPNYVPDLKSAPSLNNGASVTFFNGRLFVGTDQGLLMVDVSSRERQDVPMWVSPSFYLSNETPIFGVPYAQETDNGWLVVALFNGTDSHVCYTRPRESTLATIPNPMIWHGSECTIPGERITMMFKSGASGRPIMIIGTHDGTRMHLYYLSLPKEGDPYLDYLNGGDHEFATESRLYYSLQDGGDANAKKVIRRFDTQADGLSLPVIAQENDPELDILAGDIIDVKHAAEIAFFANSNSGSRLFFEVVEPDADVSEWVYQGIVTDSPKATMIPATTTASGYQVGVMLRCTLLNMADDPDIDDPIYAPFAVRSVKIRTDMQVEQLEQKTYAIKIGEYNRTNAGRDHNQTQTKWVTLTAMQDADAVYMIDEWHERLLVKVEPGMKYRMKREGVQKGYSIWTHVKVTFLGRQFFYDIGQSYDSIYSWGP